MGCHTHYHIPLVKGKENIINHLKEKNENYRKKDWWDEECEKEHQYFLSLGGYDVLNFDYDFSDVKDYKEGDSYDIVSYGVHSVELISKVNNDYVLYKGVQLSDEPRIGGYPETIIKSADEMFEAIEKGLYSESLGKQVFFHIDNDRKEYVYNMINNFFKENPEGIIIFG
jgi:hypothetical protein